MQPTGTTMWKCWKLFFSLALDSIIRHHENKRYFIDILLSFSTFPLSRGWQQRAADSLGMLFIKYVDNEGNYGFFIFLFYLHDSERVARSPSTKSWRGFVKVALWAAKTHRGSENGLIILLPAIHMWIDWITEWIRIPMLLFVFGAHNSPCHVFTTKMIFHMHVRIHCCTLSLIVFMILDLP